MKKGNIGNIHKRQDSFQYGDTIVGTNKKGELVALDYPLKRVF